MKYKLEIQSQGFNINSDEIIDLVKDSLKHKKIPLTKIKDLKIYYVPERTEIHYVGFYNDEEVKGTIYATDINT